MKSFKSTFARRLLLGLLLGLAGLGLARTGHGSEYRRPASPGCIEAKRWEAADRLFRSDSRWLGGDGAASVDLGHGRVLWLFGDSFIDPAGAGTRRTAALVRNSIAVQTGYDPSQARMAFFWKMDGPNPADFFPCTPDAWYWPGSGIMMGKRLLLFLMKIQAAPNALGFDVQGWKAVIIENPQDPADQWQLIFLKSPQKQSLMVGAGNPVLENGYLYVFAADAKDRAVYLVRWPERAALCGTLTCPQWWAGEAPGWVGPENRDVVPQPVIREGQMEFSVEFVPQWKAYLQVQTLSFAHPCVAMATAPALTGPWSDPACFYAAPEQGGAGNLIYAAKSHPMLQGADMAFTYVVNTTIEDRLLKDMDVYFPIMLRGRIYDCPE